MSLFILSDQVRESRRRPKTPYSDEFYKNDVFKTGKDYSTDHNGYYAVSDVNTPIDETRPFFLLTDGTDDGTDLLPIISKAPTYNRHKTLLTSHIYNNSRSSNSNQINCDDEKNDEAIDFYDISRDDSFSMWLLTKIGNFCQFIPSTTTISVAEFIRDHERKYEYYSGVNVENYNLLNDLLKLKTDNENIFFEKQKREQERLKEMQRLRVVSQLKDKFQHGSCGNHIKETYPYSYQHDQHNTDEDNVNNISVTDLKIITSPLGSINNSEMSETQSQISIPIPNNIPNNSTSTPTPLYNNDINDNTNLYGHFDNNTLPHLPDPTISPNTHSNSNTNTNTNTNILSDEELLHHYITTTVEDDDDGDDYDFMIRDYDDDSNDGQSDGQGDGLEERELDNTGDNIGDNTDSENRHNTKLRNRGHDANSNWERDINEDTDDEHEHLLHDHQYQHQHSVNRIYEDDDNFSILENIKNIFLSPIFLLFSLFFSSSTITFIKKTNFCWKISILVFLLLALTYLITSHIQVTYIGDMVRASKLLDEIASSTDHNSMSEGFDIPGNNEVNLVFSPKIEYITTNIYDNIFKQTILSLFSSSSSLSEAEHVTTMRFLLESSNIFFTYHFLFVLITTAMFIFSAFVGGHRPINMLFFSNIINCCDWEKTRVFRDFKKSTKSGVFIFILVLSLGFYGDISYFSEITSIDSIVSNNVIDKLVLLDQEHTILDYDNRVFDYYRKKNRNRTFKLRPHAQNNVESIMNNEKFFNEALNNYHFYSVDDSDKVQNVKKIKFGDPDKTHYTEWKDQWNSMQQTVKNMFIFDYPLNSTDSTEALKLLKEDDKEYNIPDFPVLPRYINILRLISAFFLNGVIAYTLSMVYIYTILILSRFRLLSRELTFNIFSSKHAKCRIIDLEILMTSFCEYYGPFLFIFVSGVILRFLLLLLSIITMDSSSRYIDNIWTTSFFFLHLIIIPSTYIFVSLFFLGNISIESSFLSKAVYRLYIQQVICNTTLLETANKHVQIEFLDKDSDLNNVPRKDQTTDKQSKNKTTIVVKSDNDNDVSETDTFDNDKSPNKSKKNKKQKKNKDKNDKVVEKEDYISDDFEIQDILSPPLVNNDLSHILEYVNNIDLNYSLYNINIHTFTAIEIILGGVGLYTTLLKFKYRQFL